MPWNEEMIWTAFLCFWLAVFGAALGSFSLCVASRWAEGEKNPFAGRSHCNFCGHMLGIADLIPVFSFLLYRGRCRYCDGRIPVSCLWAEIVLAAALCCAGWRFDWNLELLQWLIWAALLFALSLTDILRRIIPDEILLALAANRAVWFFVLRQGFTQAMESLFACAVPVCLLGLVLVWEKRTKREVMGGGDIKLLFALALYMDWARLFMTLLTGCLLGLGFAAVTGREQREAVPFGPFLAAGALLTICFGEPLLAWYFGLF